MVQTHSLHDVDWHPHRDEVMRLFEMHPAIRRYTDLYYGHLLSPSANHSTVSVHFRLGYDLEPNGYELHGERTEQMVIFIVYHRNHKKSLRFRNYFFFLSYLYEIHWCTVQTRLLFDVFLLHIYTVDFVRYGFFDHMPGMVEKLSRFFSITKTPRLTMSVSNKIPLIPVVLISC